VALPNFVKLLSGIKDIGSFEFKKEDIMRDEILIEITERYDKWKSENGKM
jgi:phosphate starvation-inducible protein PhoH